MELPRDLQLATANIAASILFCLTLLWFQCKKLPMDATNTEDGGEKSVELRTLRSPQSLPDTFPAKEYGTSSTYNLRDISLQEVTPVDVSIRHVTVNVDEPVARSASLFSHFTRNRRHDIEVGTSHRTKNILQDVSADIPSGTLTAILGGSGSGKTTLLNVLSSRIHGRRLHRSGTITFNNSTDIRKIRHAYVMQQDCLIPSLTVRESLQYAVDLRLRGAQSREARHQVVEEIILELGLKECADTRIGDERKKGCSGGEKRRTSIGVQLCENPSVLFLDEPTTGLDATSAFHVIKTLKALASRGRNCIVTIHQPRSEIWELFDRVVLLTRGSCAYSGTARECASYFSSIGYQLPAFVNPAEFIIDLVAVDNRSPELEAASTERVEMIKTAWKDQSESSTSAINQEESRETSSTIEAHKEHPKVSIWRQIRVLTHRTFVVTIRDPMGVLGIFIEAILMSIITGWIFYKLDGSLDGIRSRQGAFYVGSALQGYLILMFETYRMSMDIQIFDRERSEGVVSVSAFLISRRLAKLIEDIPVPLIWSVIFYSMCGLGFDGGRFLIFFFVLLIEQYIAVAFATLCVAVSRDFAIASLVGNLAYTWQTYACGFFVQVQNLPVYLRWTKWTAFVFYAFGALCTNEFAGNFYDCPEPGGVNNPACEQYNGNFQLQALSLPSKGWVWRPIVVLLAFCAFFYLLAGFILHYIRHDIKVGKARKSNSDKSAGKERKDLRNPDEVRTVNIHLNGYALDIDKRKIWSSKPKLLSILKPVTITFERSKINVIMGPSGSGKTSLLLSMAGRLKSSITTRYKVRGQMLFNGAEASPSVVESIISFVTQDDEGLLPSLTVRETLRFAAALRLPSWMTKAEKYKRADEVLLKMGLKDCANNIIGNQFLKGISGGERRRVSIGIQLLTDPKILLLDEPTSGLDGFIAQSIMQLLQTLAEEGRLIVASIHQSRSDLWPTFQNVLLLARGGHPVYAGPGNEMLQHFASHGFQCPSTTNPADFALDLITVDLRHAVMEAATREKVQLLIASWQETSTLIPGRPSINSPAELSSLRKSTANFWTAFPILARRSSINFWRERNAAITRIMQVVGYGVIMALFFAPLKSDYASIQTRLGFVQQISPLYFVGMLQNVAVYPTEKTVFYREHDDRAYGVEAFFLQYLALELPFLIVTSLIFAVLTDITTGLPRTAELFFIIAYNCFCIVSCGESLGITFNTFFSHTGFAVNITSVFLSISQLMGGTMSINIPSFLQAFNHLSPAKYSIASLAVYTFTDVKFTCTSSQKVNGQCPIQNGEQVLSLYHLNQNPKLNLMALGILAVCYRLVAYVVLKVKREKLLSRISKCKPG